MQQLRQISELIETWPPVVQVGILVALVIFSILSIYGRVDINVGAKLFSNVPKEEIRTNWFHIIRYTIIPVLITFGYVILLFG